MLICPTCREGAISTFKACPRCRANLTALVQRRDADLAGMLLDGRYELTRFLTEGGMGFVYRGKHLRLGSDIAVKLMKSPEQWEGGRLKRFELEARAASQLHSPHVISVLDFGRTPGGVCYIATEYLEGTTLAEVMRREGALPLARVLRIFAQFLSAVEDAHQHRVIHRDLKPDNIMVTAMRTGEDFIKVFDFGIARVEDDTGPRLTIAGDAFGTPEYMSPEQVRGEEPDPRVDLYACGVILFEMLTGQVPFMGKTILETMNKHLNAEVPSVVKTASQPLPEELDEVLRRALDKTREGRFQTAAEFRAALYGLIIRKTAPRVQCMACHRRADSALGACSDQCATPYDELVSLPVSRPAPAAPAPQPTPQPPVPMVISVTPVEIPRVLSRDGMRVSRAGEPAAWGAPLSGVPGEPPPLTLVGREQEVEQLRGFLAGDMAVLEIVAPEGFGRTAMLDHLAWLARQGGRPVWRAGPDPSGGRTPWHAARELTRQALGLAEPRPAAATMRVRALQGSLAAQDVPGLVELFRSPAAPCAFSDGVVAFREALNSALRALTSARAGSPPPCIIVDDVGDLDAASRELVRALARKVEGQPVRLAMATDASILPPEGLHTSMYLRPLDKLAVEAMLAARLTGTADERLDLARGVAARAAGNLLFLDQALRAIVDDGLDPRGPLSEVVRLRMEWLPGPAMAVLAAAAVLGRSAPVTLLRRLVAGTVDVAAERAALVQRGWFKPSATDLCVFMHPVLAETVHDLIPAEVRRELHKGALAAREGVGEPPTAWARHAEEGGLDERALEAWERAGDLCVRAETHEDAGLFHYQRAVRVARWKLLLDEGDPAHVRISLKQGESLRRSGHMASAEVVFKAVAAAARGDALARGRAWLALARVERARGSAAEAVALARRAAAEWPAGDAGRTEAVLEVAEVLAGEGRWEEVDRELAPGGGSTLVASWRTAALLAVARWKLGQVARAAQAAEEAVAYARRSEDTAALARAHLLAAEVMEADQRPESAAEHLSDAADLFRRLGDRRGLAETLLAQAKLGRSPGVGAAAEALTLAEQVRWTDGARAARRLAVAS
jgi:serine/threonine-protein kinase